MAFNSDAQKFNTGNDASIGATQFNDHYWQKKALIEATKEQYFQQMADVTSMPKNMGKKIKRYHYLPLLDDANINDQGIDAAGNLTTPLFRVSIPVTHMDGEVPDINSESTERATDNKVYFIGEGTSAALAADAAITALLTWARTAVVGGGLGLALVGANDADFATTITTGGLSAFDLGYRFGAHVDSTTIDALAVYAAGNIYGSSKDIGFIAGKFPTLTETGGRVNRVGHKRIELEGTFAKYGFFDEYTQESLDFDTDSELRMHVNREMIKAANEMTEDKLQIDLLNSAGIVRYTGDAVSKATTHGSSATPGENSVPSYNDLMRLSIELDETRTPKSTKMITGSRMVDTKTVQGARYMFIGSELEPTIRKMTDISGAGIGGGFIGTEQYGSSGTIARGEIGQVGPFKFIVVPEMLHWAGAGAAEGTNTGYRQTGGNYDVFPMLVVGSESFTTIGFQTDGKSTKFSIKHVKPGSTQSYNFDDPYGELGFMSIKWHYGFMVLRPERIALMYSVAEW